MERRAGREAPLEIGKQSDVFLKNDLPELGQKLRIEVDDLEARAREQESRGAANVNRRSISHKGTYWAFVLGLTVAVERTAYERAFGPLPSAEITDQSGK